MGLRYWFICDRCSYEYQSHEELTINLTSKGFESDIFVHDESWEDLPKDWRFIGKEMLCPKCIEGGKNEK